MTAVRRLRAIPSWQVTLGVALLALGFLIAAQLASEGPRVRYTTQERTPLVETANELQSQQDVLKQRILDLRAQIQVVEGPGRGLGRDLVRQLNDQPRAGAHRGRPDRADRDRDRPPARGFEAARPARWQRVRLPRRLARHPGRRRGAVAAPAPRRSRSTASGSRRPPRSSTSGRRCWSTRPTWRRRTRSRRSGRPTCTTGSARRAGFVDFVRVAQRGLRHRRLVRRAGIRRHAGVRRDGDAALLAPDRLAGARPAAASARSRAADDAPRSKPAHDRGGRADPRAARRRPAAVAGRRAPGWPSCRPRT